MEKGKQTINQLNLQDTHIAVNNFSFTVGTKNGSGSQTSNITLLRALFKMGLPVSGKNLFPSNIQGLPTWYTIRINHDGFVARKEHSDIVVAMNPDTFLDDLKNVIPGGVFFYADHIRIPIERTDIVIYPMPVQSLARESGAPVKLRDYIANMVYVGVLSQMLDIDMEKIHQALVFHFKGKEQPIDLNFQVISDAANWAKANLKKVDPYRVVSLSKDQSNIMTDGNTAAALGAIYGGVQFVAWYPITPATSISESLNSYLPMFRKDTESGKNTFAVIQSEDEIAAIGMAIGAGWAGLRAMTATSGPGLSLMAEYAGLAYFAEIPLVVWDVQRVGPSTGLPTRTSQGDLMSTYFLGHGDSNQVILLPGHVGECFEFGWKSFDIAERLQTPVFVLSDLDLGMNQWMTPPFKYPESELDRGKILWENDIKAMAGKWGRYVDIDQDGIPYRTVIGNREPGAGYLARGTGHNEFARYSEDAEDWQKLMARLQKKLNFARTFLPKPEIENQTGARIGILAYGSSHDAIHEARALLNKAGIKTNYLRIKALPFASEIQEFLRNNERNYVIELNRDGQMYQLLTMENYGLPNKIVSITHHDGLPLTADRVFSAVSRQESMDQ